MARASFLTNSGVSFEIRGDDLEKQTDHLWDLHVGQLKRSWSLDYSEHWAGWCREINSWRCAGWPEDRDL